MKLLGTYRPGSNQLQADLSGRFSDKGPLLLLMRHSRIDSGPGRHFIGRTDLPLDETGKAQAAAWKPVFDKIRFSRIHVSGLQRCARTAELCCPGRHVTGDDRINEIDLGDWEGQSFDQVRTQFPREFAQRGEDIFRFRPPGGESFEDLYGRAAPFFQGLERDLSDRSEPAGHALVITHAGVIRVMCCHWAGTPMADLLSVRPGYGQVFVLSLLHGHHRACRLENNGLGG